MPEELELQPLYWENSYAGHAIKHFLACSMAKGSMHFALMGAWTHRNNSPTFGYIGQLRKLLQLINAKLGNCWRFSSNARWDCWWNPSDVVRELEELGIKSLYHQFSGEGQGQETLPSCFQMVTPKRSCTLGLPL